MKSMYVCSHHHVQRKIHRRACVLIAKHRPRVPVQLHGNGGQQRHPPRVHVLQVPPSAAAAARRMRASSSLLSGSEGPSDSSSSTSAA